MIRRVLGFLAAQPIPSNRFRNRAIGNMIPIATKADLPQNRSITPDLAPHKKCSYEHSLCRPLTNPAAPAPRRSGNSSTTAGTLFWPTTKNVTARISVRSTPPPRPLSNPSSAVAISPQASPASSAPTAATNAFLPSPASSFAQGFGRTGGPPLLSIPPPFFASVPEASNGRPSES